MGRKSVKTFIRGGRVNISCVLILKRARISGKNVLHCNGIDPFATLMGKSNLGHISRNDIVSGTHYKNKEVLRITLHP